MSKWNYRVLAHEELNGSLWLEIHEVYYKNGVPYGYSNAKVGGGSLEELTRDLELHKLAFNKPILYAGERFPEIYDKMEIISDAKCKHCKFAKQERLMKKDGTYSKRTTTSCVNKESNRFNQIISLRDLACDYLEL